MTIVLESSRKSEHRWSRCLSSVNNLMGLGRDVAPLRCDIISTFCVATSTWVK